MAKVMQVNTGTALLLNDKSEAFSDYDSIKINAGSIIASRKAYDKLLGMGVKMNSGDVKVLEINGEVTELAGKTVITEGMSFDGKFLICDGSLIIESAKGLENAEGIYADNLFYSESVDMSKVKNVTVSKMIVYPDGTKLKFGQLSLGDDAHITLESGVYYWVHGRITALNEDALERLRDKKTSFHCRKLIIYSSLYEKYRDMFKAEDYIFIPDGYNVVEEDLTLDAATALLYGDKLLIHGDMMIPHDQTEHLKGFESLIIKGTVTMPVSCAASFKAVGKADDYSLYEGALMEINGFQTIGHGQLQTAIKAGLGYTIEVNGALYFTSDVTAEDMEAICSITCNGLLSAPDSVRGILDSKVKELNGTIVDIDAMIKKIYGEDFSPKGDPIGFIKKVISEIGSGGDGGEEEGDKVNMVNTGTFKL